jgi:hypothetical protein
MRGGGHGARTAALAVMAALVVAAPARAASVQISALTDVTFTSLNPLVDATRTENVCVFSNTLPRGYNVTARGSGAASAFTLSAGGSIPTLPYTVQWSATSGASAGTTLAVATPLTGQTSVATSTTCHSGPSTSASLIVILRTADLQAALSGVSYSGTLSLTIAPE